MKMLGILLAAISAAIVIVVAIAAASDSSGISFLALFGIRNPIIDFAGFWFFVGLIVWIAGILEERLREVRDALKARSKAEGGTTETTQKT